MQRKWSVLWEPRLVFWVKVLVVPACLFILGFFAGRMSKAESRGPVIDEAIEDVIMLREIDACIKRGDLDLAEDRTDGFLDLQILALAEIAGESLPRDVQERCDATLRRVAEHRRVYPRGSAAKSVTRNPTGSFTGNPAAKVQKAVDSILAQQAK